MFLIQTYAIEDCIKYISSELTSSQSLSIPNIPTNFKASFKVKCDNITQSSNNTAWLEIGSDSDNFILLGNSGSKGHIGIFIKKNGNYVANDATQCLPAQTWTELTYTYNNGVQSITDGTNTVTLTNSDITARNYSYFRNASNNKNPIKELKIKPL